MLFSSEWMLIIVPFFLFFFRGNNELTIHSEFSPHSEGHAALVYSR